MEILPIIHKTPEYFKKTNYRNPDDPMMTPLQYTYDLNIDGFTWLHQNPESLTRFNNFMEGQRAGRPHWGDWFPVLERILTHPDINPNVPLLVDVGAGRGHDLIGFKTRFPNATGRFILEDLPSAIEEVRRENDREIAGIETVAYDFFAEEQPVRGKNIASGTVI